MSQVFQVVTNGVVTNLQVMNDAATLSNSTPPSGSTFMNQTGAGMGWTLSNGVLVGPAPPAPTQAQLAAYANAKQWALATGGHNVEIGEASYLFTTDPTSMSLLTGAALWLQQSNAPTSISWQFASGFATLSAANLITAAANVAAWVQSTFTALEPVLATIAAGSITTYAQIDDAVWPTP